MKLRVIVFSIIFISILCSTSAHSQSEVLVGQTVNSIVDNLSDRIKEIINDLEGSISRQAFDIRTHLQLIIGQLDYVLDKNIDKVFEKLDEQQRELLNNIDITLSEFERTSNIALDKLDDVLDKAIIFSGTLPFSKRIPAVRNVSPSFIGSSERKGIITIDGAWLAKGSPYLIFEGERIDPIKKIDNELRFEIPLDKYKDIKNVEFISAKLNVFKNQIIGKKMVDYQIAVSLVPNLMGNYLLFVKTKETKKETKSRSENFSDSNGHCAGGRDKIWTFNSLGAPWKIDVNSISDRSHSVSSKSKYHGKRSVSHNGFQIAARIENNGECIKVLGKVVARDGRGSVSGSVSWTEYKLEPYIKDQGLNSKGELKWGKDISLNLPQNLSSFRLEITQLDGEKKIINKNANEDWYQVRYNPNGATLTIKPRNLNRAMNARN